MLKLLKKYINFIFQLDEYDSNTTYNKYVNDIKLYELCKKDPLNFIKYFYNEKDPIYQSLNNLTSNQLLVIDKILNKNKLVINTYNYSHITHIQTILVVWMLLFYPNINIIVITQNNELSNLFIQNVLNLLRHIQIQYLPKYECNIYGNDINTSKMNSNIITLLDTNSKLIVKSIRTIEKNINMVDDIDVVFFNQCSRSNMIIDLYMYINNTFKPTYICATDLKDDLNDNYDFFSYLTNRCDFKSIVIPDDINYIIKT